MNFKETYERFLEGTASAEEIEFVRSEMKRAREIDAILEHAPERDVLNEAEVSIVKTARKKFNLRNTIRIIVVVLCVLVLLAGGICGYIFGTAISSAKRNSELSRDQALDIAEEYLAEFLGKDTPKFYVHDIDRHLFSDHGLRSTVFCYQIELRDDFTEYELTVNAGSGYVTITDVDYRD